MIVTTRLIKILAVATPVVWCYYTSTSAQATQAWQIRSTPSSEAGKKLKLTPTPLESVLYNFCSQLNCSDGAAPNSGLVLSSTGAFYGTSNQGGAADAGTLYSLTVEGSSLSENVLYSFCSQASCIDGASPGQVYSDSSSSLYGTFVAGGSHGEGGVFKFTGQGSTYNVLYSFCSLPKCADGANPAEYLIMDRAGAIYGSTSAGGTLNGGTLFKLTPRGSNYQEDTVYDFCGSPRCNEDHTPSGLVIDATGTIFGSTGGAPEKSACGSVCGTVFELRRQGPKYVKKTLHHFCSQLNCTDGYGSAGPLVLDSKGDLYGTTNKGGTGDAGTVFKLTRHGETFSYNVLHSFCSQPNCADGSMPEAGVVLDSTGALYGTTSFGGNGGASGMGGTVFVLTGSGSTYTENVLYNFCSQANCFDGWAPLSTLTFDSTGALYGTTVAGGANNSNGTGGCASGVGCGTAFRLSTQTVSRTGTAIELFEATQHQSEAAVTLLEQPPFRPDSRHSLKA